MPNTLDVKVDNTFIRVFVCGDPGSGKSQFGKTFPTPGYLLNYDNTELSYRGFDFEYENYSLNPKGWIQSEKDVHHLTNLVPKTEDDPPFPYKSVIVDSTTSWSGLAMERALQLDPKRSLTNGPMWNVHYSMVRNLLEGSIRRLLELPCNLVIIGHVQYNLDEKTGAILGAEPMLTGQLSTIVPGYFDEVYYSMNKSTRGNPSFVLLTAARGHFHARSRISGKERLLPDELSNDYQSILNAINKAAKVKKEV